MIDWALSMVILQQWAMPRAQTGKKQPIYCIAWPVRQAKLLCWVQLLIVWVPCQTMTPFFWRRAQSPMILGFRTLPIRHPEPRQEERDFTALALGEDEEDLLNLEDFYGWLDGDLSIVYMIG